MTLTPIVNPAVDLTAYSLCWTFLPYKDFIKDGFSDGNSKKYFYCFVAEDQSQDRGTQWQWRCICMYAWPLWPSSYSFIFIHSKGRHIVGYAFYFFFYSSWFASQGLHLEDVYVEEEYRRTLHVHALLCIHTHIGCGHTLVTSPSLIIFPSLSLVCSSHTCTH